jgi:PTH1 family peptidyl-tRNA hydrolase
MNQSGLAVRYLVEYYQPEIRNLMIIHDDLDLEAGRLRIVRGGGAGGHHGVESVILQLKTNEFNRIKIGIGRPRHCEPIEDFVLTPPYDDQQNAINDVLHVAVNAIELFVLDGVEPAMNTFNSPTVGNKEVEER